MKRTVTKPCQCCGNIMVNVNRQTRFCEECKRIKGNAAALGLTYGQYVARGLDKE